MEASKSIARICAVLASGLIGAHLLAQGTPPGGGGSPSDPGNWQITVPWYDYQIQLDRCDWVGPGPQDAVLNHYFFNSVDNHWYKNGVQIMYAPIVPCADDMQRGQEMTLGGNAAIKAKWIGSGAAPSTCPVRIQCQIEAWYSPAGMGMVSNGLNGEAEIVGSPTGPDGFMKHIKHPDVLRVIQIDPQTGEGFLYFDTLAYAMNPPCESDSFVWTSTAGITAAFDDRNPVLTINGVQPMQAVVSSVQPLDSFTVSLSQDGHSYYSQLDAELNPGSRTFAYPNLVPQPITLQYGSSYTNTAHWKLGLQFARASWFYLSDVPTAYWSPDPEDLYEQHAYFVTVPGAMTYTGSENWTFASARLSSSHSVAVGEDVSSFPVPEELLRYFCPLLIDSHDDSPGATPVTYSEALRDTDSSLFHETLVFEYNYGDGVSGQSHREVELVPARTTSYSHADDYLDFDVGGSYSYYPIVIDDGTSLLSSGLVPASEENVHFVFKDNPELFSAGAATIVDATAVLIAAAIPEGAAALQIAVALSAIGLDAGIGVLSQEVPDVLVHVHKGDFRDPFRKTYADALYIEGSGLADYQDPSLLEQLRSVNVDTKDWRFEYRHIVQKQFAVYDFWNWSGYSHHEVGSDKKLFTGSEGSSPLGFQRFSFFGYTNGGGM